MEAICVWDTCFCCTCYMRNIKWQSTINVLMSSWNVMACFLLPACLEWLECITIHVLMQSVCCFQSTALLYPHEHRWLHSPVNCAYIKHTYLHQHMPCVFQCIQSKCTTMQACAFTTCAHYTIQCVHIVCRANTTPFVLHVVAGQGTTLIARASWATESRIWHVIPGVSWNVNTHCTCKSSVRFNALWRYLLQDCGWQALINAL